jgi:hypothetical protein
MAIQNGRSARSGLRHDSGVTRVRGRRPPTRKPVRARGPVALLDLGAGSRATSFNHRRRRPNFQVTRPEGCSNARSRVRSVRAPRDPPARGTPASLAAFNA